MARSFANAQEAKRARCPKFKRLMDERDERAASLAPKIAPKLGAPVESVQKMIAQIRGGFANVSVAYAEAAAPYLGTSAEELLIRPMDTEREQPATSVKVTPVNIKKTRGKKPPNPARAFRKFLKQRQLSVAEVVRRISGSEQEEETLVDASQKVGEVPEELWRRIQNSFAAKPEEKSEETVITSAVAESNGHPTSGQVLFEGLVAPDQLYQLLRGNVRISRVGGALVIDAQPRTATPGDRDTILQLVLPELSE